MSHDEEETRALERDRGGAGRRSGEYSANAELAEILRSIMREQRETARNVTDIKERLARGSTTLDAVPAMQAEARDIRDQMVEMRTKMSGIMWVAAAAGATAIGGIVTAIAALLGKGHA
jgi:hypothetical protein